MKTVQHGEGFRRCGSPTTLSDIPLATYDVQDVGCSSFVTSDVCTSILDEFGCNKL
jgi:hypothetical protein